MKCIPKEIHTNKCLGTNVFWNSLAITDEAPVKTMWLEPRGTYADWESRVKEEISAFY